MAVPDAREPSGFITTPEITCLRACGLLPRSARFGTGGVTAGIVSVPFGDADSMITRRVRSFGAWRGRY